MTDKWRKEIRYQLIKDGKFYSSYDTEKAAKKKAAEFEKLGHETKIKKAEVEVMPLSLFNEIFGN